MTRVLWLIAVACAPLPVGPAPSADRGPRLGLEPVIGGIGFSLFGWSVREFSWVDIDADGALDFGVSQGLEPYPSLFTVYTDAGRTFAPSFTSNADPYGVAAWADADGDGDPDLLIAGDAGTALFTNDAGALSEAWRIDDDLGATALRWADVDGDGDADAAAAGQRGLVLWRNPGDGTLDPEVLDASLAALDAAWVDVDADGLPELSVGTYDGLLILDNVDGSLVMAQTPALLPGTKIARVAWGDWVGDGQQSPAVVTDREVLVYSYSRLGFQQRLVVSRVGDLPTALCFADFDVDDKLDLAVGWASGRVEVLHGYDAFTGRVLEAGWDDGDGLGSVMSLAAADSDGDGDPDLAVGRTVDLGGFTQSGVYESIDTAFGADPAGVTLAAIAWDAGDADGDGDLDIAAAHLVNDGVGNHAAISLATNTHGRLGLGAKVFEFPPATKDDDGILVFEVRWADLDADGDLDLALATSIGAVLVDNRGTSMVAAWYEPASRRAFGITLADLDADGDLDLAVGGADVRLYANDGGVWRLRTEVPDAGVRSLAFTHLDRRDAWTLTWSDSEGRLRVLEPGPSPDAPWVERPIAGAPPFVGSLAPADVDDDGDDELYLSRYAGDSDRIVDLQDAAVVTRWQGVGLTGADLLAYPTDVLSWTTFRVRPGDLDNDGIPDFSVFTTVYQHRDAQWVASVWASQGGGAEAWVDLDRDGRADLLEVSEFGWWIQRNVRGGTDLLPFNPPRFSVAWGDGLPAGPASAMGASFRRDHPTVEVVVQAYDAESDPIDGMRFEFRDWGGGWREATVEGLSGTLDTAPLAAGGLEHRGVWRWADDGADGEAVVLRAVLDRPHNTSGEIRGGRVAAETPGLRLLLDGDGDGRRESSDPCPTDAADDSLVPGVCDSRASTEGMWCASAGGRTPAAVWLLLVGVITRRRAPSPGATPPGTAPAAPPCP